MSLIVLNCPTFLFQNYCRWFLLMVVTPLTFLTPLISQNYFGNPALYFHNKYARLHTKSANLGKWAKFIWLRAGWPLVLESGNVLGMFWNLHGSWVVLEVICFFGCGSWMVLEFSIFTFSKFHFFHLYFIILYSPLTAFVAIWDK